MNYYNPYFLYPYTSMANPTTNGILGGVLGSRGFSFSTLLNGAEKTLNFVNQAIPVVKQVSPMMRNAKTMFRVMNEFKKVDTPTNTQPQTPVANNSNIQSEKTTSEINFSSDAGPTFFA